METQPSSPYGSLAQSARSQELKKARIILWIIGVLTIIWNAVQFGTVESQLDTEINKELAKSQTSIAEIRKLPPKAREVFDTEYDRTLKRGRLIAGGSIGLGVIFILCALAVNRKPVAATVTGLVLYLGGQAAFLAFDPEHIAENIGRGIILKIIFIAGLASAVKAALAIEREQRTAVA